MIETVWTEIAGRSLMQVRVGGPLDRDSPRQAEVLLEEALRRLAEAGFSDDRIVRSRVWARSAPLRQVVSDARLRVLREARRGASASFIAPRRLPAGVDAAVDVAALEGAESKRVREYEPPISPPRYVAREGLVFLSGVTDTQGDFAAQLHTIVGRIGESLATAGTGWDAICDVRAYVHHTVPWRAARDAIRPRFPCAVEITPVEGYSAPEKRVEIEVTARA